MVHDTVEVQADPLLQAAAHRVTLTSAPQPHQLCQGPGGCPWGSGWVPRANTHCRGFCPIRRTNCPEAPGPHSAEWCLWGGTGNFGGGMGRGCAAPTVAPVGWLDPVVPSSPCRQALSCPLPRLQPSPGGCKQEPGSRSRLRGRGWAPWHPEPVTANTVLRQGWGSQHEPPSWHTVTVAVGQCGPCVLAECDLLGTLAPAPAPSEGERVSMGVFLAGSSKFATPPFPPFPPFSPPNPILVAARWAAAGSGCHM